MINMWSYTVKRSNHFWQKGEGLFTLVNICIVDILQVVIDK